MLWCTANGRAASYTRKLESHWRAHFKERWKHLRDITPQAIEHYKVERSVAGAALTTVYKELVTLSRFLKWCKRAGYLEHVPEFERVKPVSTYAPPNLSASDVRRLLKALPSAKEHKTHRPVWEFFTVQWAQALRPGELRTLTWGDVDLERKRLTVRASNDKARAGRTIGMAPETYTILVALHRASHAFRELVFGGGDYRESLRIAAEECDLPKVTPHHLRHARLSELASKSRDIAAVQYLAGHKHLTTTDRYVRSRTERTERLLADLKRR